MVKRLTSRSLELRAGPVVGARPVFAQTRRPYPSGVDVERTCRSRLRTTQLAGSCRLRRAPTMNSYPGSDPKNQLAFARPLLPRISVRAYHPIPNFLSFSSQKNGRVAAKAFDGNAPQMRRAMQSIFRPTRQARSAFLAEAASSNGLNRRDIVAGACACGVGALIGAVPKCTLAAEIMAARARPIHQRLDAAAAAIEATNDRMATRHSSEPRAWQPGNADCRDCRAALAHVGLRGA